jgi:hypothetical protein
MSKRSAKWTNEENQLLQQYWYKLSLGALLAILPGRSRNEMQQQVWKLERKNWEFER